MIRISSPTRSAVAAMPGWSASSITGISQACGRPCRTRPRPWLAQWAGKCSWRCAVWPPSPKPFEHYRLQVPLTLVRGERTTGLSARNGQSSGAGQSARAGSDPCKAWGIWRCCRRPSKALPPLGRPLGARCHSQGMTPQTTRRRHHPMGRGDLRGCRRRRGSSASVRPDRPRVRRGARTGWLA